MAFKASQNSKLGLSQIVPNYASDLDKSKVYETLLELEDELDTVNNVNTLSVIYPGKIVYVLETKKHYILDLEINSNIHFDETIQTLWVSHINSLNTQNTDISASNYFLVNNPDITSQRYVYYELYSQNIVPSDIEDGHSPITKDGELIWVKVNYNGDFSESDIADESDTEKTFLFEVSGAVCDSIELFTSCKGYKIDKNVSSQETTTYTSKLIIHKSNFDVQQTEYGVLSINDLDVIFDVDYNPIDNKIKILASKKNNDTNYSFTVENIIMSVNIAQQI